MASDKALEIFDDLKARSIRPARMSTPFTKIEDGLFLGGKPGTDGINGFTLGQFPKTDAYLGVNEHPPDVLQEGTGKAAANIKANLWLPIHDRPPFPGCEWLDMAVDFVCFCRDQDWSIYCHCSKGESRSAMVIAAFFMKRDGLTVEKAIAKLAKLRAIIPQPAFIDGLFLYHEFLKGKG